MTAALGAGASRPLSPPIHRSSAFAFDDPDTLADAMARPDGAFVYSRRGNPTVRALEHMVADLEGGEAALATASGMGAISSVLMSILAPGDHVVAQSCLYGGTHSLLTDLCARWGIQVTHVSGQDAAEVRAAITPRTRMLYLETISNPTTRVCDLPALLAEARTHDILSVVDNSFASPLLCTPIAHGADIVVNSTSKYLAGHSDVIGGIAVFADKARFRSTWARAVEMGANADPLAAWLTLRGIQTLPLRMARHCSNARRLAHRLTEIPSIAAVHWPGLPSHPDHAIATAMLSDFGGVLAFDLAGGREAGRIFTKSLRLAALAPSLGGVETLVLHPASSSHRELDEHALNAAGIGQGTVRVSVGLEHPDDIVADFVQALAAV
ncbi:MAG: aminotransferase class I/II-fold pyridoxal phosphate-dependent enzyme [Actinomycetota bacterium]|nr:aminotransferase class I/II-fold pyridoxal phosphate-dependent enzyme [Actinomycetota bacterium]